MIRVMLVDDHEVVRIGLRSLLQRVPDLEIVAEAGSSEEAIETVERLNEGEGPPDVIVMDVRMPGGSGIDACRRIRVAHPDVKVIMLTSYTDDEAIFSSVMAGASGYVLKQVGSDDLVKAIHTVYEGGSLLDPNTTHRVLERMRQNDAIGDMHEPLTDQERRILGLISEGKTNREIASVLFLSEKTVRNYVSNILGKLNLANRAEAAAFAVRHGLTVDADDEDQSK